MSFLDHPSLKLSSKDRRRADGKWTPPSKRGILAEPEVKVKKPPKEFQRSMEERLFRVLRDRGSIQLRISFAVLERETDRMPFHYKPVNFKNVIIKGIKNPGTFWKIIEGVEKLGVDVVIS